MSVRRDTGTFPPFPTTPPEATYDRGVDGSTVLECPEVTRAFSEARNLHDDESITKIGKARNAGANRLIAQGIDLDGYTMLETIEDNESVRTTLGDERGLRFFARLSTGSGAARDAPGLADERALGPYARRGVAHLAAAAGIPDPPSI